MVRRVLYRGQDWDAVLYKERPAIDRDRCIGCNLCSSTCPHDCLEVVDGVAVLVNPDDCRGEAFCVSMCPTAALRMKSSRPKVAHAAHRAR